MGDVRLERWADEDAGLLVELNGDPEQMEHLGGPETAEKLADRQERYVAAEWCFVVVDGEGRRAGWVGFWESEWRGEVVLEMGWSVRKDLHGRGLASAGTRLAVARAEVAARAAGLARIVAFPNVENVASNRVCERAGFALVEPDADVEYPPGQRMRCNVWALAVG
jgi:RimJ/RimL family protein N-acetyltransferase